MNRWALATLAVGLALPLAAPPLATPALAAVAPQPTVHADVSAVALGGAIHVTGSGWDPSHGIVEIEICGNLALNGSVDCDVANTLETAIKSDGTFVTAINATAPPSPCPCVLRAGYQADPGKTTTPITIEGVGQRPPQAFPQVSRQVAISNVAIVGGGPWWSWFGGAPHRRVVYTVTNTGNSVINNPAVTVNFGRGEQPSALVNPPAISTLGIGQSVTDSAPLPFGALSLGSYTVTITVDPTGVVGTGQATTAVVPWGLIFILALGLAVVLVQLRMRLQRRHERGSSLRPIPVAADLAGVSTVAEPPGSLGWGGSTYVEAVEPLADEGPVVLIEVEHGWAGPWLPITLSAEDSLAHP